MYIERGTFAKHVLESTLFQIIFSRKFLRSFSFLSIWLSPYCPFLFRSLLKSVSIYEIIVFSSISNFAYEKCPFEYNSQFLSDFFLDFFLLIFLWFLAIFLDSPWKSCQSKYIFTLNDLEFKTNQIQYECTMFLYMRFHLYFFTVLISSIPFGKIIVYFFSLSDLISDNKYVQIKNHN